MNNETNAAPERAKSRFDHIKAAFENCHGLDFQGALNKAQSSIIHMQCERECVDYNAWKYRRYFLDCSLLNVWCSSTFRNPMR